jgi:hypothetical protein
VGGGGRGDELMLLLGKSDAHADGADLIEGFLFGCAL